MNFAEKHKIIVDKRKNGGIMDSRGRENDPLKGDRTMNTHTFTVFTEASEQVYGYLFNKTRIEAQRIVKELNEETGEYHYYMEGYFEK